MEKITFLGFELLLYPSLGSTFDDASEKSDDEDDSEGGSEPFGVFLIVKLL